MEGASAEEVYGIPKLWLDPPMNPFCSGCQYPVIARILCEVIEELGIEGRAVQVGGAGCNGFFLRTFNIDAVQEAL